MIMILGGLCREMKTDETIRMAGSPYRVEGTILIGFFLTTKGAHKRYRGDVQNLKFAVLLGVLMRSYFKVF